MVWVDFGKDQVLSGMSAPNEKGELTFFDEKGQPVAPKRIEVGTGYQRPKGPKVITRAVADPSTIVLDVNRHLTTYDWVFAVDTNTKTIQNEVVSVSASLLLRDISFDGPRWSVKTVFQDALEFRDAKVAAERLGWRHLLWLIAKSDLKGTIAVLVDSYLDDLAALNRREQDLLPGYHLPTNVTLIYASSDVGRVELIGNKAIAECDKRAGVVLARIEAGDSPGNDFASDMPGFCAMYRLWPEPRGPVTS
jgi:hypothetical protein